MPTCYVSFVFCSMDIVVVYALGVLAYLNSGRGSWTAVVVIDDEQTPFPSTHESHFRLALCDWDEDGTCKHTIRPAGNGLACLHQVALLCIIAHLLSETRISW